MKNCFKFLFVFLCMFSLVTVVNAETGSYTWKKKTYCFNKKGTYVRTVNAVDTSCPGNYAGTVYKQINGTDAYCARHYVSMSYGKSCTAITKYNKYSYMNGRWTEENAIKVGYMIQYIKNKKLSKAQEYVDIFNGVQQMLRFDNSLASRTLNSTITNAINYGKEQVKTYKKLTTTTPVKATFSNATLTNVNNSYATGIVNVSLVNGSYHSSMAVNATCTNCTLYTDAGLSKVYTGTTLNAGGRQNLTLYVKSNGYTVSTKATVTFKATYGRITYPIAKLWNCGSNKQPLVTLTTTSWQPTGASVSTSSTVPAKRLCQYYDGKYFGNNGNIVTEAQYKDECMKICKVEGNTYYGKDGKVVDFATYKDDCLKICKQEDDKYYGKDGSVVDKETYMDQCTTPICSIKNNQYYGKDGKVVDEATYKNDCLKICKQENDKYYGKDGTVVDKDTYMDQCTTPVCSIKNGKYYGKSGTVVDEATYKDDCLKICKIEGNDFYGSNGQKVDEATYKDQCTTPVCAIKNGEYYGKNGQKVDESTYRDECLNICKVVDGKYYGSNGEEVTEDRYKDECVKTCVISDGKYYGSNGNEVSEEEYNNQCSTPICGIRDGKYYGLNATEVSFEVYRSQCLASVSVPVESTGTKSSTAPIIGGSLLITLGVGSIIYSKKKKNM